MFFVWTLDYAEQKYSWSTTSVDLSIRTLYFAQNYISYKKLVFCIDYIDRLTQVKYTKRRDVI